MLLRALPRCWIRLANEEHQFDSDAFGSFGFAPQALRKSGIATLEAGYHGARFKELRLCNDLAGDLLPARNDTELKPFTTEFARRN